MKIVNRKKTIAATVVLVIFSILNCKIGFYQIPVSDTDMTNFQFNLFNISAIFGGFTFTALGIILGLSSEKLIEKLAGTRIISDRVTIMVNAIGYFILSCICSIIYITGFADIIFDFLNKINQTIEDFFGIFLFSSSLMFLILGIIEFIHSVKELTWLLENVYKFNNNAKKKQLEKFQRYQEKHRNESNE